MRPDLPRPAIDADAQMRLDDDGGPLAPTFLTGELSPHDDEGEGMLPSRQCGRCRQLFEGDPTLRPPAPPDWWLCPPCRVALLGDRARPPGPESNQTSVGTRRGH